MTTDVRYSPKQLRKAASVLSSIASRTDLSPEEALELSRVLEFLTVTADTVDGVHTQRKDALKKKAERKKAARAKTARARRQRRSQKR